MNTDKDMINKGQGRHRLRNILIKSGAVLFASLIILSGLKIFDWYQSSRKSQSEFDSVTALLDQGTTSTGISGKREDVVETAETKSNTILKKYQAIYELNNDFTGWIAIEDTRIDYPVMQSPDDPDFYLKHNFEKEYSVYGVPYMQSDCDILSSDNLVIYGHHMKDDSMFSDLCSYTDETFYEEHKYIRFDTKYSYGTYEIIAVFTTTGEEEGFPYHLFVNASDEQAFDDYVANCKELSLYDIETTAVYGDRLITLSTCEYTHRNGRMVIVAKLIKES